MSLSDDEIRARIDASKRRLYRPVSAVARSVPVVNGLPFGLPALDRLTGGIPPRKLNLVAGFTGHGKTTLMLSTAVRNRDRRILVISCDDTDDILLAKMLGMYYGISTDEVAEAGPDRRAELTAEAFPTLVIATPQTGTSFTVDDLATIYDDASEDLGGPVELVIFDYLSLLLLHEGESDNGALNVRAKAIALKALIRDTPHAVWLVGQQCNRQAGSNCPALLMVHIEYGGIQETDGIIVGARRRIDTVPLTDSERWEESVCPTTHLSVMKNKITGKRSENPAGVPHAIDPVSSIIRELTEADKPIRPTRHLRFADAPDYREGA